jgi:formate hydrogenlyase subunit 4
MAIIQYLLLQGFQMMLVLAVAPLLIGIIRKVKARLLCRIGPSVVQPYRDLIRLIRKDVVVAHNASWLFLVTPYIVFAAIWVAAALVPTFALGLIFSWSADIIVIVGLLALARFFQALAGLDVGTAFGGIGTSREMMIASLAEPAMLMIVFTLSLLAQSTQLSSIAHYMMSVEVGLRVSCGLALMGLVMVAIAENGRVPVDNPATHLELTMIHEAMILEYSGRHLALIELASALKLTLYLSMLVCVFVPWGMALTGAGPLALAVGAVLYLVKIGAGSAALAVLEVTVAKMRVFRVVDFLNFALMLGLLAALLLFVSRSI